MKTLLQHLIALSSVLLCSMQVFTQGGNVGIGTINPLHPLHVETTASMSGSRAIYGLATAAGGASTFGVYGESSSTNGTGVFGRVTASTGFTYAVYGENHSTTGRGVVGHATAFSGSTYGVYGESLSNGGTGVFGHANASSDITYGVYGKSLSTSGRGVYGEATAGSGTTYGVYGKNLSNGGIGVFGDATASSGFTYGVYGHSSSTFGRGVFGHATASSGSTYGVWGQSSSTSGRGVYGAVTAGSGATYGIYGDVNSPDGFAGYFTGTDGSRNYFQRSVGIGTSAPSRLLHVRSGTSGAGSNSNSVAIFESAGNTYVSTLSGADDENGILFSIPAHTAHGGIIYNSSATPGGMHLRTGGNLTQMTILSDGNVGIGTTAPDVKFEIHGSAPIGARMTSTTSGDVMLDFKRTGLGWRMLNTSGELLFAQTDNTFSTFTEVFRIGGGSVTPATDNLVVLGQSGLKWTAVWAVNGVIQTSDQSLKKNIAPLSSGINTVRQMQPVMFSWLDDRQDQHQKHYGFLAQDLLEVLPDVVVTHEWREIPDTPDREWVPVEHLGVNYSEIIPVLVKAVQEQQELLEAREAEIEQLNEMLHMQQEQISNILSVLKNSVDHQNR